VLLAIAIKQAETGDDSAQEHTLAKQEKTKVGSVVPSLHLPSIRNWESWKVRDVECSTLVSISPNIHTPIITRLDHSLRKTLSFQGRCNRTVEERESDAVDGWKHHQPCLVVAIPSRSRSPRKHWPGAAVTATTTTLLAPAQIDSKTRFRIRRPLPPHNHCQPRIPQTSINCLLCSIHIPERGRRDP
jgi:hypothetical protein